MKQFLLIVICLIFNVLSMSAQNYPKETIKTVDGNIYIGKVVTETDEVVKIEIGQRTIINIKKSNITSRQPIVSAQYYSEETIKTVDGNIYVGKIVTETDEVVKIEIGQRTIVSIKKSNIISREPKLFKKRNHIISAELSNYYLFGISGINYDFNLHRKNNLVVGGTMSVGLLGFKLGSYAAFRQKSQDLLKLEAGIGGTAGWGDGYLGPYVEAGYRSQRDSRWFYWELSLGGIIDNDGNGVYYYGSLGVGVSF